MHTESAECPEESIQLKFGLGVASFTFIPRDGPKTGGATLVIFTFLGEDPTHAAGRGVNPYVNRAVRGIVDGDESWRVYYRVFEGFHGLVVLLSPDEGLPFAGKVD
jgi:hypothetical protein